MNKNNLIVIVVLSIAMSMLLLTILSTQKAPQQEETSIIYELKTVPSTEFLSKMQSTAEPILIDVRTRDEFLENGLEGAKNIDFYSPSFRQEIEKLDRNKTYFIYCRSGNRSGQTLRLMQELGFTNVYNMGGGMDRCC